MQAKKTTKKSAKKTYSSRKKTVPTLKKKSAIEELAAVVAKTQATMAENHAKTEAAIERLSIENKKTVDALTENVDRMSAKVEELSNNLGYVSNNLGAVVEYIVIPQIRYSINTVGGHSFTDVMADKKIRAIVNNIKKDVTEVDVFLYNDTEAMAVEVKTSLNISNVNRHLNRLQKLREHEEKLDITHKKLFGAIAGIIIDPKARELALKKGLYVVEIKEDEELLDVEKPETCGTW